jgi:hypothetical protein
MGVFSNLNDLIRGINFVVNEVCFFLDCIVNDISWIRMKEVGFVLPRIPPNRERERERHNDPS